jgi:hypothetical protein
VSEPDITPSALSARKGRKRLRLLLAILCVVVAAFVISRLDIGLPRGLREPTILDDPFVTKEAVLAYLDGKKIQPLQAVSVAGEPARWLVLKREQIENLEMKSDDPRRMSLRFTVNDEHRHYVVEADLWVEHSDSPELHYHSYTDFTASVVREE